MGSNLIQKFINQGIISPISVLIEKGTHYPLTNVQSISKIIYMQSRKKIFDYIAQLLIFDI